MDTEEADHRNSRRLWLTVLLTTVIVGEAAFLVTVVRQRGFFDYVGLDYRGTRSAGRAILDHGFSAAYDLRILEQIQRPLFDLYTIESSEHGIPFAAVPAPYPPPFSLAFVPSTFLPPVPGFLAWTLLHVAALALYQLRLAQAFGVRRPVVLIAAVAVGFPALVNLIMGQLSVWLVLFFGEAMIAFDRGKAVRAGAWLGLLIFKPQVLVLILPALALAGLWRVLLGTLASVAVLVTPTLIASPDWFGAFFEGLLASARSAGAAMNIFPSSMTNWRALAVNAGRWVPSPIAWAFSSTAMIGTALAGLSCSTGLRTSSRQLHGLAWLGLSAATCAFTWHAHVHQLLLLVPPIYAVAGSRPEVANTAAFVSLGSSALFLIAAFTLGVGHAHDILGLALLACLVVVTAASSLRLRAELTS